MIFRGTVSTGLGGEECQVMLSDLSQQPKMGCHSHKTGWIIAFIFIAQAHNKLGSTSVQYLVYFYFKGTKYMLHSNIIKTVKQSDKRKGLMNCLLQFSEFAFCSFQNREKQARSLRPPAHCCIPVQVLNLV